MDGSDFDALARSLLAASSRRHALAAALGGALGLARGGLPVPEAAARKKCPACKKRRRGKCKGKLPDGTLCAGGTCQGGKCTAAACPAERACGSGCCPEGDLCVDPFTQLCGKGAGTCPPGADVCGQSADARTCSSVPGGAPNGSCFCFITIRGFSFCGSTGGCTPTNNPCESDAECVATLNDVEARCVQGPACCGGGTQCRRPCPS